MNWFDPFGDTERDCGEKVLTNPDNCPRCFRACKAFEELNKLDEEIIREIDLPFEKQRGSGIILIRCFN